MRAVARHQQPTRKARLEEMKARARGGPSELTQRDVDIAIQTSLQSGAECELAAKCRRINAPRTASALHQRPQRRMRYAQCQPGTEHALVSHEPHLELRL